MNRHRQRERFNCGILTYSLSHAWGLIEDIVMRIFYMKRLWAHQWFFKGKRRPGWAGEGELNQRAVLLRSAFAYFPT